MAAGDQHGVGAHLERLDDQVEIDAPGAGQADDPHVGRILQPVGAGQVGAQVRAPVAHVGDDLRFECRWSRSYQALHHRVDLLLGEAFQVGALRRADGHARAAAHAQPGVDPGRALDQVALAVADLGLLDGVCTGRSRTQAKQAAQVCSLIRGDLRLAGQLAAG